MSARVRFLAGGITGGHIGPPLRGVGGVWEPTGIGAERCLSLRGGTEPAPYRGSGGVRGGVWSPRPTGATQVVRSSGPMYLRHGFRRPNFVPKFGAPVMGIGPYGETGKSQQTPGPAAHSGASAARSQGMGGNCDRDHPQRGQQPRTIPQSPSGRQLPLHKGALGTGDADCRVGPAGLLAMTMVFCHSEERSDVGIRPFLRWTMDGGSGCPTKDEGTVRSSCPAGDGARRRALRVVLRGKFAWAKILVGFSCSGGQNIPEKPCNPRKSMISLHRKLE